MRAELVAAIDAGNSKIDALLVDGRATCSARPRRRIPAAGGGG
jgi:hypothetical protein